MFHLLTSLYTDLTQRPKFNILFLGSAVSGKTTLLQIIKSHHIEGKPLPSRIGKGQDIEQLRLLLPKTRSTVGQNVLDLPAPLPSHRPLVQPSYPLPNSITSSEVPSSTSWFSPSSRTPSTSRRPPSKALIHIWDLGGDLGLRKIWEKYYAETDAVIYFWDCERGGNGEGRENEWSVVAELARDRRLCSVPFLLLLSRCDLITPGSHSRRPSQATVGAEEIKSTSSSQLPTMQATLNQDEVAEDRQVSVGVTSAASESHVDKSGLPALRDSALQTATVATPIKSLVYPDDRDALDSVESLRVFIESHIEAATRSRTVPQATPTDKTEGPMHSEDLSHGTTGAEAGGDEALGVATGDSGSLLFPEITIVPLSVVTGRGVEECMDWIVHKSLGASTTGGHRDAASDAREY